MHIINCTGKKQEFSVYVEDIKKSLDNNGIIVYPTDTLYALGCNPFRDTTIRKIFDIKKRPLDVPLSIAVYKMEDINNIAFLNDVAIEIIKKFLPGPLTIILRKKGGIPDVLTAGSENVAVRIPDHPIALEMLESLGPLTATSANLHGTEEPIDMRVPLRQFKNSVDFYVNCGKAQYGKPSTIIDLSKGKIKIIREGAFPVHILAPLKA